MAIAISNIPVLKGEAARTFIRKAKKAEKAKREKKAKNAKSSKEATVKSATRRKAAIKKDNKQ